MIVRPPPAPSRRRRGWLVSAIVLALVLTGGFAAGPRLLPAPDPQPVAAPVPPSPSATPPERPSPSPSPSATTTPGPENLTVLPGRVPTRGTGKFAYAPGRGKVLGSGGGLRRFRVAVERGSGEDVAAFAAQVEATLGDRRSWIGGGRLRLQRVSGADASDFTVYLATRETAGVMCARGGVNIRVGGRPYTSCRATGKTIINLDRWRLSARPYVAAKVPLATYRDYVLNHEVGHELGKSHQGCPKRGGPAPVMVQQTLTLRGCTPYAWPRRGSRELAGPYL